MTAGLAPYLERALRGAEAIDDELIALQDRDSEVRANAGHCRERVLYQQVDPTGETRFSLLLARLVLAEVDVLPNLNGPEESGDLRRPQISR